MKIYFNNYKILLVFGILFFVGGCNLLVVFLSPLHTYSYLLYPTILLVLGLAMLIHSLIEKKKTFFIFIGLLLCSAWLLFLLVLSGIIPYSMVQMWPVLVLLSGIMLVPAGFIRYGFLPVSLFVSACVLFGLGVLFLLFSLDIIEMSITTFASRWWPMIFVLFGISLIGLFFYTQKHKQEKWVKSSDDDED